MSIEQLKRRLDKIADAVRPRDCGLARRLSRLTDEQRAQFDQYVIASQCVSYEALLEQVEHEPWLRLDDAITDAMYGQAVRILAGDSEEIARDKYQRTIEEIR